MQSKLHFLESFGAQGSDGRAYKVCGYERLVETAPALDGLLHWEPTGQTEYRLDDGRRVQARADGSAWIADSDIRLRAPEHGLA
jgi:hypothetical protein